MKRSVSAVIVGFSLFATAWASEEAPATAAAPAPEAPAVAPAAPAAPAAVVATPAEREETTTLVGSLDVRDKGGGNIIRVFVDRASGKRMVLPSNPRQLPAGFVWGNYAGDVEVNVILLYREKDGKAQTIVKRILGLKDLTPAPVVAPAEPEITPAPVVEVAPTSEPAPETTVAP